MTPPSPRWWLGAKAVVWRELMKIGMALHKLAPPRPAPPSLIIDIPSRVSSRPGSIKLFLYVPDEYKSGPTEQRFPVVVNFHGGGFTLGTGTDDARWAKSVVEHSTAVLVSVEYRLAPKYPFSVAVEDGTDAILYLAAHAEELRLDPHRIALSGFSAGGNLAFTVPLMLHELRIGAGKREWRAAQGPASTSPLIAATESPPPPAELEMPLRLPPLTITAIVSFYPVVDFRIPRDVKKASNPEPAHNLPDFFTSLFDEAYISLRHSVITNSATTTTTITTAGPISTPLDLADPYLSPSAAPDALLRSALPPTVVLYTCEYDMLKAEALAFGERLAGPAVDKLVRGRCVKAVPHAFDRKPDPWRWPAEAESCYAEACAELNAVFGLRGVAGSGASGGKGEGEAEGEGRGHERERSM